MANVNNMRRKFQFAAWVIGLAMGVSGLSLAATTDLASAPLQTTTTAVVLPNVMFMLDDSGSMAWDYLPDVAQQFSGNYGFNSSQCNGVYFNPNITYSPPVTSTGTSYPASSFSAAWKNGYNTAAGTVNLNSGFTGGSGSGSSGYTSYSGPAFFYTYSGTQTTGVQMNYFNSSSTFYNECNSSIGSAPGNAVFTQTILSSALPTATITIPGNIAQITVIAPGSASNSTVTGITVGGVQILSGTTNSSKSAITVAGFIANYINNCTTTKTGNCTVTGGTGYSATIGTGASANVVTITGSGGAIVITHTGNLTETVTTPFPTLTATQVTGITVNGTQLLLSGSTVSTTSNTALATSLAAKINAIGYSAAVTSGNVITITGPLSASNTPTVITTNPAQGTIGIVSVPNTVFSQASSAAQLQNFANWYSYYSNRMMMMETSVGLAFSPITANYRIGFMTMNNNVSPDYVDIAPFNAAQKSLWYTKLYASAAGNSTPLREALSHVGQLYAHKFGSITTYKATITVSGSGVTAVDSIQVNGVETFPVNASTPLETITSALATDIANQINAPDQTDFGATASGNVVTIVGPAWALGYTPVITDIGAMTETATAFTATTTTAQLNGITPLDPMQYSCQQNFVILSTDGYWNGPNTYDLNNNPVGQQDGVEPRPMNDGGTPATQTTTQVLQSTSQVQQTTQQVQSYTTNLQSSTSNLQKQTSQLQQTNSTLQGTLSKVLMQCNNTSATCGTAPSTGVANGNWSVVTSGACTVGTNVQCSVVSPSGTSTVATSCNTAASITTSSTSTPPANTTSYPMSDNSHNIGLGSTTTSANPDSTHCVSIGTSGSGNYPWFCRGSGSSNPVSPINSASVSDATGKTYYLVSSGAGSAGCTSDSSAFASGYSTSKGACPGTTGSPIYTLNNADSNGKVYSACSYTAGAVTGKSSCTAVAQSTGPNYTVLTATQCNTVVTSAYANAAPCTVIAPPDASGYTTQCRYTTPTTPANVGSCPTVNQSASSPYTVGTATQCTYSTGSWINTSSCTAVTPPSGPNYTVATVVTSCQTTNTTVGVLSCTPSAFGVSGIGTTIICPGIATTGPTAVASCTNTSPSSGNNYTTTTCNTQVATSIASSCTAATASSSNNWTTTTCTAASGGTPNTLADVAEYYYATDLRDGSLGNCTGALGTDVCLDNVPTTSLDSQHQQHMTTFTLGLGARGKMVFPTPPATPYQNLTSSCNPATDGDFCAILTGPTANGSTICSWQASGTICNWPIPSSGSNTNVDDLWHAAVDGRGIYFSATNPTSLSAGLSSALAGIQSRLGAASASATSSPNLTQSNNYIFSATYVTTLWDGEVTSRTIDPTTGNVSTTILWSAQTLLDNLINGDASPDKSVNRHIYMFDSANASGNNLKPFLYGSMTASEQAYFNNQCNPGVQLMSQCTLANLSVAQIASGNSGLNLIDYLRGSQSLEAPIEVFRPRNHFLGDTVDAKPLYVKFPVYSFNDAGYSTFVSTQTTLPRQGVLYVGANDGMLHAFNADTGVEMWAYVPKIVMPNLYKLADVNYATQHQYYVDGSPATIDIYVATATNGLSAGWHTILVGGLGLGGQGFYALDVTDPTHPQALWEICSSSTLCAISDADMGYSYGDPVITKRSTDGKWVVLLSSGYNNAGSGKGTLFELDAVTGAVLHKTTTDTTATNPPSGLAKLSPWIDSISTNFTARYVYGGDLNGNVWRFDLGVAGPDIAPTVTEIASLVDGSGAAQSVTTRVELSDPMNSVSNSLLGTGKPGIFVATGRYLGATDLSNLQVQSIYGIKDDLSKTGAAAYYGNPRAPSFVKQYIYQNVSSRTTSQNAVDWTLNSGWYADFVVNNASNNPISPSVSPGERVNIDPQLVNGTLIVVTNVPYASACTAGGTSWLYSFNFMTGTNVSGTTIVGQLLNYGTAMSAGFTVVRLSDGELKALVTDATGNVTPATPATHGTGSTKQTSWRELMQ